ncbi:MAG: hypothetical protein ACK4F7_01910, partial [Inhella sp.]
VQGTVSHDRFTDGLRGRAAGVFDLAGARARFAKALLIELPRPSRTQVETLRAWVARHPPQTVDSDAGPLQRGLAVRWPLQLSSVSAELELGEASLHWPSSEALQELQQLGLPAQISYR